MGELYQKMERDLAAKNRALETLMEYLHCCCNFVHYPRPEKMWGCPRLRT